MLDATPTPNKPMELYTMIGHLDKDIFKEYGIHSEMDFAGRYFDNGMAPDRNGEFKSALTGINNAPELRAVMDRYVDRISMEQFASMGYIKIPDKKIITHTLEASSESITAFDVISKKLKDKKELLGAYANGINASADPRLYQQAGITDFINPTPQNNKLHAVVDEVLKVRGKDAKAGQIIFLDNAGHTAKVEGKGKDGEILPATLQKNLHQEMKEKFVASGKYKESEIAILSGQEITNPKTGKEISASGERGARLKEEIVEAYNAGKIKVIIGTTQSAGEGMNIQKFTTDIYHMDIPWTMAQIIQRDGRGVRYGNMYDSVNSHFFFQQGTFDELSYKTVMNKKSWNEALWDSNLKEKIEIQSEGGAMPSPDEIALALEKDPVKKRQMQLQVEYNRYNAELDGNYDALGYLNSRVSSAKRDIELYTKEIGELNAKLKLDAPNEGLKNLQQRILKESDKTKKSALQDEFSAKLAKVKEATKRTIELRQKKIGEKNADIEKFGKEVQTIREDIAGIKKQLEEFEGKHFDERGNIKSEFEEVC